jgi:hypothetical protein
MKKLIAGAILGMVVVGGPSAVLAGEVDGTGGLTPINGFRAGSICSFSGLDDGSESGAGVQPGVTQNWGTSAVRGEATNGGVAEFAKAGVIKAEGPGTACRGYASGGGGEG